MATALQQRGPGPGAGIGGKPVGKQGAGLVPPAHGGEAVGQGQHRLPPIIAPVPLLARVQFPGARQRLGGTEVVTVEPLQFAHQLQRLRLQVGPIGEADRCLRRGLAQDATDVGAAAAAMQRIGLGEHLAQEVTGQLGALGLAAGLLSLPGDARDRRTGGQRDGQAGGHAPAMALQVAGGAIAQARGVGQDGTGSTPALQVLGQRVGAGVARFGIVLQRLHRDRVQVAAQLTRPGAAGGVGALQAHARRRQGTGIGVRHDAAARCHAGQQPVEQGTQAVHVHRGAGRGRAELFRRGVFGGEHPQHGGGLLAFHVPGQAGDAEIQQDRASLAVDQDVRGLDVAMDDQVAVGIGHRRADLQHQVHAPGDAGLVPVAPLVDAFTFHQRHREPRRAVGRDAGFVQAGDTGVAQARERPLLLHEAFAALAGEHAQCHHLHRSLLPDRRFDRTGAVDRGHAAMADPRIQAPPPEPAADPLVRARYGRGQVHVQHAGLAGMAAQPLPEQRAYFRIGHCLQRGVAGLRLELEQLVEPGDGLGPQCLPGGIVRGHRLIPSASTGSPGYWPIRA